MRKLTCFLLLGMMFVFFGTSFKSNTLYQAEGEILVKFKSGLQLGAAQSALSMVSSENLGNFSQLNVWHIKVKENMNISDAIAELRKQPFVEYAEPNYIYRTCVTTPNDQYFSNQWGLNNTGQTGGLEDADIDATEAWDIQTGDGSIVIGVIDSGVDYNHPDLVANIWTNPGEDVWTDPNDPSTGNGIDDDGNGKIDDWKGWNFITNTNDPMDDNGHGSHCAGIIGAEGNNSTGVCGVNWNAKILPLKFLNSSGSGTTADAIEAVLYATEIGVDILSNSWGGTQRSQALEDAIILSDSAGILFVTAAGNDGIDTDNNPHYPSTYDVPNVIAVAASDALDDRSLWGGGGGGDSDCGSCSLSPNYGEPVPFKIENGQTITATPGSNYGAKTVDLAAPGSSIYSTVVNGYGYLSGTSMAAPFVAGALSLIKIQYKNLTHLEIKERMFNTTDYLSDFDGKTVTEGRLNLYNALLSGS